MKPLTAHATPPRPGAIGLVALALTFTLTSASAATVISVRDQGATGDGQTLDTAAIQQAIDACAEAGGGQVVFPPGTYRSGTIRLKSQVTLILQAGSTLAGSESLDDYAGHTPPEGSPERRIGDRWHRSLIQAVGVENIGIEGPGTIDGRKVFDPRGEERMRGPHAILIVDSRGVRLHNLRFRDAANYAVMMEEVSDVEVRDCTFRGGWDGVHFRGLPGKPCRDVVIADCRFFTGDDAIAGRYWERTLITGCVINSSCNGIRLIGPARDLIIHDCLFYGPGLEPHRSSGRTNMLAGINLQPGGWDATEGPLDEVLITDVSMRDVSTPLHVVVKKGNTAGSIRVDRLSATGAYLCASSFESWAESPIERVSLRDVTIEFTGGGQRPDPEAPVAPVKPPGADARPLPAWGLFFHGVAQVVLDDVRLDVRQPDARPAVRAQGVGTLDAARLHLPPPPPEAAPAIELDQVERVRGVELSP